MSIATTSLPELLNRLQNELALSNDELAGVLGLSPDQLEPVRERGEPLPSSSAERLDQLVALTERLQDSFQPEGVVIWVRSNLRYAHRETALALMTAGRFDRITAALDAFDAGIFI